MVDDDWRWRGAQEAIEAVSVTSLRPSWWLRFGKRLHLPVGRPFIPASGVYMLVYHSVVDPEQRSGWEHHYRKGEVAVQRFATQLDVLCELMTPLPLSAVPALWEQGGPDRPYFVVTFDDGLSNNLRLAHPIIQAHGIRPAVFVSAASARGEAFYRILVAILVQTGLAGVLATALRQAIPDVTWSGEPERLFDQTKQHYRADVMEQTVRGVYVAHVGPVEELNVHMDVEQIRFLHQQGWEIANHTVAHRMLAFLDGPRVARDVEENAEFWQQAGIPLIPFLGYPFGRACHVNKTVQEFMRMHPELHGVFAGGGVNFHESRGEWLRFSLGAADTREKILEALRIEATRTRVAFSHLKNGQ
ncbi:MAG: polysaccharide deacetylase family protein [Magnetococcales bacterium]|nr:polysaccharide deacetylase family protein [Magnetococcales bacterium]